MVEFNKSFYQLIPIYTLLSFNFDEIRTFTYEYNG